MKRALRAASVVAALGLAACPALELPASTTGITNTCTTNASCASRFGAGAVCNSGACVAAAKPTSSPIYVVHVGTTDLYGAGYTFAFTPTDFSPRPGNCNASQSFECNLMPFLASAEGTLSVTVKVGKTILPPKGLLPNVPDASNPGDESEVSLPVELHFEPLWLDPASQTALPANDLGLPLPAVRSQLKQNPLPPAPTNGTELGFGVGFFASVPLSDSPDGRVLVRVEADPVSPYEGFPPVVQSIRIGGGPINNKVATLGTQPTLLMKSETVKIVAAEAPPRDYRAYIVRASDGVRVSSVKVLSAAQTQDVVLYHVLPSLAGTELVLEPPDGSEGLITQRVAEQGGFAPGIFPAMAPPVTISGKVILQGDLGNPVEADLVFDTKELVDKNGQSPVATYRRRVRTTNTGDYTVSLLAGRYDVWAIPRSGSLSALTLKSNFVVSAPQVGAGISVDLLKHVRGRVVLPDGSPVNDAIIQAKPTPETYAGSDRPVLPREASASTDATGKFDLLVDGGGTYDLTIRPSASTRLPWVVTTKRLVTADLDLATDLVVPVPSVRRGILLDAQGNTMVRTLIRAYAFPDKSTVQPGEIRPARLVGETYTDALGRYELFLGPSPN